jgi:hypothetical protein
MIQPLFQRTLGSRQARFLALLAVLLLAGTPALEAIHDHDTGPAYADCLLCKQAPDLPIVSASATVADAVLPGYAEVVFDVPALQLPCANYSPRGPPAIT